MRLQLILASSLGLLLAPGVAYAQTEEIQQEVEVKLWIQRVLTKVQGTTGAPPFVAISLFIIVVATLLVACIWLWRTRRHSASK